MTPTEIKSCEDALRVLALHLDGELDNPARAEVERHLSTCRSCYSRAEFETRLKTRVASIGEEPVRPELARRVHTLIRRFTVAGSE
jgi:anti-sigma factor (TIGR02949 family)